MVLFCAALLVVAAGLYASPLLAADMPANGTPSLNGHIAAPAWTGFYAGLNAGGVWVDSAGTKSNGFTGGGQIGFNWQVESVVFGLEADIQGTTLSQTTTGSNAAGTLVVTETARANFFGTVRGRAGYAFGAWLPYITAGLLYTTIEHQGAGVTGVVGTYSASNAKSGWTFGGGVEWMFAPHWSAKLEYLYAEINGYTNTYTTTAPSIIATYDDLHANIARIGVNYHF